MTMFRRAAIAAVVVSCGCLPSLAAPFPDTTFAANGLAVGAAGPAGTSSFALEGITADRREGVLFLRGTLDATDTRAYLTRLKSNGTVDATFASSGSYLVGVAPAASFSFTALALDRRRILAALGAAASIAVHRLSEDGVADTGFGTAGVATLAIENTFQIVDVIAQADRKVLVVTSARDPLAAPGTSAIAVFRLTESGAPDASFGTGGAVYTAVPGGTGTDRGTGVALQPDGRIVVVGRSRRTGTDFDAVVARYNTNGTLDASFGAAGIAIVPFGAERAYGRRIAIQPDGKLVVTGTVFDASGGNGRAGLFRLDSSGALDVGFGASGSIVATLGAGAGAVFQIALQPDGRPVTVGYRENAPGTTPVAVMMRHTAFGTLDTTWDADARYEILAPGFAESNFGSVALDERDRILAAGSVANGADSRWMVARLKSGPTMECR